MKTIADMSEQEMVDELSSLQSSFRSSDFVVLENHLILRAYVLGWTGDPLRQPVASVLAAARQVIAEKGDPS